MRLTGNTRYRASFRGKLILQVEERRRVDTFIAGWLDHLVERVWRDARITDFTGPDLPAPPNLRREDP